MTDEGRNLLKRALRLSQDEREALAAAILNSVEADADPKILELDGEDPPDAVASAWREELARRAKTATTDPVEDWEALRDRARKRPNG